MFNRIRPVQLLILFLAVSCGNLVNQDSPGELNVAQKSRSLLSEGVSDFGSVLIGQSKSLIWNFNNNSSGRITNLKVINLPQGFLISNDVLEGKCETILTAGSSCKLKITFQPTSVGTRSGNAKITYRQQNRNRSKLLSLSGVGVSVTPTPTPTATPVGLLWKADHETGNYSQWFVPATTCDNNADCGGGIFNNGSYSNSISSSVVFSGTKSAALTITAPVPNSNGENSGNRLFRWLEPRKNRAVYYSVRYFIPENYVLTGDENIGKFWDFFQFKSRRKDDPKTEKIDESRIDAMWAFYLDNAPKNTYTVRAGWGWGGVELAGPYANSEVGGKFLPVTKSGTVPVGKWVHFEAYLYQSSSNGDRSNYDGKLIFYQDGEELFNFSNIATSYPNCDYNSWCGDSEWSVNLYSDGLSPGPSTVYIDDAAIGLNYIP